MTAKRTDDKKPKPDPKPAKSAPKKRGPVLFVSLDDATEAALVGFITAQRVEPDRSAVGLKALREFLAREGHWPPKPAR